MEVEPRFEEVFKTLNANAAKHINEIRAQRKYFIEIENHANATVFDWLTSKGTSYQCYIEYVNNTVYNDDLYNIKYAIDYGRNVFYALLSPVQSQFFYWTILLLIMYKFNTKRPVMKLILYHYILRTMGDIVEKLGTILTNYYGLDKYGKCISYLEYTEQHPLKWFLTRQINSFFWYAGEIIGDWYPLIRTKAVAKDGRIKYVYMSCIFYNITKLSVPISQLFVSPAKLYTSDPKNYGQYNYDYVNSYYNYYWCIQAIVIIALLIYDATVYIVLKKELFNKITSEYGFLKKFRLISEYRIIVSVIIGIVGLPVSLCAAFAKIFTFNSKYREINFSIEDFRVVVTNVQYMIIFIDQILLLNSRSDSVGSGSYTCSCPDCNCSCNSCKKENYSSETYYNNNSNDYEYGKSNNKSYYSNGKNSYPSFNRNYIRTNTTQNNMQQFAYTEINRIKLNNNNNNYNHYNNYY